MLERMELKDPLENLVLLALLVAKEMKEIELLLLKIFKLHGGLLETLDLQVFLALMVTMAMMADQEGLVFPVIRERLVLEETLDQRVRLAEMVLKVEMAHLDEILLDLLVNLENEERLAVLAPRDVLGYLGPLVTMEK